MPYSSPPFVARVCLSTALLVAVGCAPKQAPRVTVADLMEDRVALDGVLMKCNEDPAKARNSSDCLNARIAVERLASDVDPAEEAKRDAEFEKSREKLRVAQDKQRQEQEQKTKVDPYNLPVVPVDGAPAAATGAASPGTTSLAAPANDGSPGLAQARP